MLLLPIHSLLETSSIELHYFFNDDSHTMDAVIQNRCEYEFLNLIKEVSKILNVVIEIETEPLSNGGLRRWFKIISKTERKTAVISTAIIISFATTIFITPISTAITEVTEKLIENIFDDSEMNELAKEKLKSEIENIKADTKLKQQQLNESKVIKKRRSNFYETISKYSKVDKVSIVSQNSLKQNVSEEVIIHKASFKEYILISDDIDSIIIDDAVIEIVAPVLKKGVYKWIGIYNGNTYHFNMKSNEFKTLVQIGNVEFKNGSSINCQLEITKMIDNEGVEKTTGYNILRVNQYFENDQPIETPEGKKHRQISEAEKKQIKIDFNRND